MQNDEYVYNEVNKAWKNTCKVVLGDQVGELKDYEKYMRSGMTPLTRQKSTVSKKEVIYDNAPYCKNAKFMSFDEIDFNKKYAALNINELKDLESIINAVQDRIYYTGNIILGNSKFIETATSIYDSFYVYETANAWDCKYIAYNNYLRSSDNIFGSNGVGTSSFCIRSFETYKYIRCFELWWSQNCSDCYYGADIENCQDCMFSFNVKNKKHCIGNLELPKEKYFSIKQSLLEEIRESLLKRKKAPSLIEIVNNSGDFSKEAASLVSVKEEKQEKDMGFIEKEFSSTTRLLLGRALSNIDDYKGYLLQNTPSMEECTSALSKSKVFVSDYANSGEIPRDRLITEKEGDALGEKAKLTLPECEKLSIANAQKAIGKIAFFAPEYICGKNANMVECSVIQDSTDCYRSAVVIEAKKCAYSFWPRNGECDFGCSKIPYSKFSIKCYLSKNLTRCFECDSCENCTDLYFSHNCENVHDSMFCFNVKNKRNAIGNVEYPKEQYAKIKAMVLEQISKELEKNKSLKLNIYNLGCFKK